MWMLPWALLPSLAAALGPHEVLVLANGQSPDSIEIAKEFARRRQVPDVNIVRLSVPLPGSGPPAHISRDGFTRHIWSPAVRAARERGIDDHILAWVYSVDLPVTVRTDPKISVQGLTFLRNEAPDPTDVRKGTYTSPLYGGPLDSRGATHYPQTLDAYGRWLGAEMPLPSMMLGYTGPRGSTKETVLECMDRGVRADGRAPTGTVYFVKSKNIRSRCRHWQYPAVVEELEALGVRAEIVGKLPRGRDDVVGVMMGAARVNPAAGMRYRPGCMAEHLTSLAAVFQTANQTKLTAWIDAGATASAGTVTEPYSIWTKFPGARFYVYYASGCTMLESFYQSIRCPLQVCLVGEPLAQPWARGAEVVLEGIPDGPVSGVVRVRAVVRAGRSEHYRRVVFLLDGRVVGNGPELDLDTAEVENGVHRLRAVAYRTGFVCRQAFREVALDVQNP
jgi:uncharacterized protein (TIGR03790 family)